MQYLGFGYANPSLKGTAIQIDDQGAEKEEFGVLSTGENAPLLYLRNLQRFLQGEILKRTRI